MRVVGKEGALVVVVVGVRTECTTWIARNVMRSYHLSDSVYYSGLI